MGAMVVASMSMFTSCKDYDDDINKNSSDIAALRSELTSLRQSMAPDLTAALAALESKVNTKIDLSALAGYATTEDLTAALNGLSAAQIQEVADAAGKVAALETQIAAIDAALASNDLSTMAAEIAALTGEIDALKKALAAQETGISKEDAEAIAKAAADAAVKANLEDQAAALEALEKKLTDEFNKKIAAITTTGEAYDDTAIKEALAKLGTDLEKVKADLEKALKDAVDAQQKDIKALQDAVKALQDAKFATTAEMEAKMTELSTQISAKIPNIDVLNALVNKILTSVTLIPQAYIDGIEAIQFISVRYVPQRFLKPTVPPAQYADATNDKAQAWPNADYYTTPGTTPAFDPNTGGIDIPDHNLDAVRNADGTPVAAIRVDNGQTEAYYRLSPAVVKEEEIDVDNIKFYCTTATTETRAADIKVNNPVKPTFKSLENGILTVNLTKTVTGSLRFAGEGAPANIASLMVPRKANAEKNVDYAEIYSEHNLLDETVVEPRIAALNRLDGYPYYAFNRTSVAYAHTNLSPMTYHFIDSLHIFRSQVDCADLTPGNVSGYLYVKELVKFDESFDLLKLVTGCYDQGGHKELTKEALKKYGIAFRFALPKEYAAPSAINQNATNQQEFAKLSGYANNILTGQLPSGRTDNRAIIGKEPVIRVMLVDTVKHNLIDQAYFKMKFVGDTKPDMEPYKVTKKASGELSCTRNRLTMKWKDFIELVYAEIGESGLSWDEFRAIYPQADIRREDAKTGPLFTAITAPADLAGRGVEHGSVGPATLDDPLYGAWVPSNGQVQIFFLDPNASQASPDADANQLWWTLGPADIKTIPLDTREKTFTTKVIFVSNQPKSYGNIELTLEYTVKLPKKPTIYGYYDNYWFEKYETVDIMPVQYKTKSYYEQLLQIDYANAATGAAIPTAGAVTANNGQYAAANGLYAATTDDWGNPMAYCVFNNNMLNAFTYKHTGTTNVNDRIYNDGSYSCEKWDIQFRLLDQPLDSWARVDYKNCLTAANKQEHTTEPLFNAGDPDLYINGGAGYEETAATNPHNAYTFQTHHRLDAAPTYYNDAIWFNWMNTDDDSDATPAGTKRSGVVPSAQSAWGHDGTVAPYLFADHNNRNNQLLINPITAKKVGEAPTRTHDKKIGVGVFYAYNDWNAESIKNYNICLVAPLCISEDFKGYFEEGLVSGSFVNCKDAFTMIDFRGYEVKDQAPAATAGEFVKYRQDLYHYYEVTAPVYDLANVRYGFKKVNNSIVADDTIEITQNADGTWKGGMTTKEIKDATNGNVVLSIDQVDKTGAASTEWLRFKNNGGSNVEEHVNVFVPCTITYGFGEITKYVKIRLHPREDNAGTCTK